MVTRKLIGLMLLFAVTCRAAEQELIVVADLGGQSTADYFAAIDPPSEPENEAPLLTLSTPGTLPVFPVRTPELSPGRQAARALDQPGMLPVFIIGDDELSRRWLVSRRDRLRQNNATGYVVNVTTEAAWQELQVLAGGLTLLPVSGSDLAVRLKISHYPVLISERGLTP
ncbi:integrating conjugative element protein [Morganella morganii]|uniref:Integrating conjugative element protein n=2 Tax=Morganella morganii TaxID=582 RepID=A0AAE4FG71_MORMO|nr:integrating conjugative element protein [Morganella morganii]EJG2204561.1 integrating conjugative element protein [Morganella morganii]ELN8405286.1 integrating conjugative element protein [Morganella morganii]MBT0397965.1 integrating conjugative element protein [Morganella morganii subsp. morganii]MBX9344369.1 integrating conjugative element protein [Morganella morganii]MBX9368137.1 integrating conjugative element protein [Morganella morganii]